MSNASDIVSSIVSDHTPRSIRVSNLLKRAKIQANLADDCRIAANICIEESFKWLTSNRPDIEPTTDSLKKLIKEENQIYNNWTLYMAHVSSYQSALNELRIVIHELAIQLNTKYDNLSVAHSGINLNSSEFYWKRIQMRPRYNELEYNISRCLRDGYIDNPSKE